MKKIMVVEDDTKNLEVLSRILLRSKFEVITPTNTEETMALATEHLPDVILMDLKLNYWVPEASGYDLTAALREIPELATVPIIALSGHAMDSDIDKALEVGCNEFVEKPIDFPKLIVRLQEITKE